MLGKNDRFFWPARIYFIGGLLHFLPLALGSADGFPMVMAGLLIILLSMALSRGYLGALVFIFAAFGISGALYGYMTSWGILAAVYLAILVADVLTAVLLFGAIWRGRVAE